MATASAGIQRLMAAGKPRQGEIELALFVAIAKLAAADARIPDSAARKPSRARAAGDLADARCDCGRIKLA